MSALNESSIDVMDQDPRRKRLLEFRRGSLTRSLEQLSILAFKGQSEVAFVTKIYAWLAKRSQSGFCEEQSCFLEAGVDDQAKPGIDFHGKRFRRMPFACLEESSSRFRANEQSC